MKKVRKFELNKEDFRPYYFNYHVSGGTTSLRICLGGNR
jgi:hypothetical protein